MHETRSSTHAPAQLDWIEQCQQGGVGARQSEGPGPAGGGGYLDECTPAQLWDRAKLRELADMGLPQIWLDVAQDLGYETFIRLWRRLDAAVDLLSENESMIEVQLRRFGSFQRFQRNRFIEALVDLGLNTREIRARVKAELGEELSLGHIGRLVARRRIRA